MNTYESGTSSPPSSDFTIIPSPSGAGNDVYVKIIKEE